MESISAKEFYDIREKITTGRSWEFDLMRHGDYISAFWASGEYETCVSQKMPSDDPNDVERTEYFKYNG
jgi:hypothetical protein